MAAQLPAEVHEQSQRQHCRLRLRSPTRALRSPCAMRLPAPLPGTRKRQSPIAVEPACVAAGRDGPGGPERRRVGRAPRYVTASVLAERSGTTVRTVERDIARLVAADVPVQVTWSRWLLPAGRLTGAAADHAHPWLSGGAHRIAGRRRLVHIGDRSHCPRQPAVRARPSQPVREQWPDQS
jgi:hypothetical protein